VGVVYTGGTFDLFHSGHVAFLKSCRRIAGSDGRVVVSLNTDEFISAYKGKPPIMSFAERKAVLMGCRYVDSVVVNVGDADSKPAIENVIPDFIVIGDDWAKKDYYAQMQFTQDWLDGQGIQLCYVPYTVGVSSTDIKARIVNKVKLVSKDKE
jgi:glycerol-3-phosphate cytidylyltransferase